MEARDKADPGYPHGTRAGAKGGCKCDGCMNAKREHERSYKAHRYATNPEFRQWARDTASRLSKTPRARKLAVARVNKRRALMLSRVENPDLIKLIYEHCPAGYTVDHIVPLAKGGVHAPDNLQYLPGGINSAKRDKLDFDYSRHAVRWQDVLVASSTAISQESTVKRPEAPNILRG
jgi:5-methylcytosine-specific restriction endonuclease McrA